MKTRILTGIIMLPLLLVLFVGGNVLILACFLIGVLGVREFFMAFENSDMIEKVRPSHLVAFLSIFLLYGGYTIYVNFAGKIGVGGKSSHELYPYLFTFWFFAVIIMSLFYLFNFNKRTLLDGLITIVGIFYVVFLSFHLALVDEFSREIFSPHLINTSLTNISFGLSSLHSFIWLVILSAFGTDTFAYFIGMSIGKHRLAPNISPKKSIEGSFGGVCGSMLLCGLFGYFFLEEYFFHCLLIGFIASILGQIGDLSASIFKRKLNIKDYGNLMPGHGGILDRFDSVLFTAPTVFYYLVFVDSFSLL